MFNRSARENILYGRPDASDEDLQAAAEQAEAHEFIQDLRDGQEREGYDAHLGERGVKLSGGQRQRVAIARALVTEPSILLADEPTGNLDFDTAQQIYQLIKELNQELSISFVVVTHDLALAAKMDRQLRLDHGKLSSLVVQVK